MSASDVAVMMLGCCLGVWIGWLLSYSLTTWRAHRAGQKADNEPHREDYIESNRLLADLCKQRGEMITVLQAERDNFWQSGEKIRQEALRTEARKDEQIATLQAALDKQRAASAALTTVFGTQLNSDMTWTWYEAPKKPAKRAKKPVRKISKGKIGGTKKK